ncbi:MAG: BON domain-containing protein [Planctomycetaceae bacterium]
MRRLLLLLLAAGCATGYRKPEESEPMARGIADRNVASRVRLALAEDPETAPYEGIDVRCEAGVVTLEGAVDRAAVKRRAAELARAVSGVARVDDRITIGRS